jgi:hypothetical protein
MNYMVFYNSTQRLCMKRGWAFEAHHCPTTPNVILKTKLQIYTEPSHVLYILLAAGCLPLLFRFYDSE